MNWKRIEEILETCTKEPSAAGPIPETLPRDYAEFLARFNGAEGFVGPDQYLMLWSANQVEALNAAYSVEKYAPGIVLIGTDGSDTGFGVRQATGQFVCVPLIGMSQAEIKYLGNSFDEFLERLAVAR